MSARVHRALDLGMDLLAVYDDHADWSEETFGADTQRGPLGPLRHLEKEAKEAQEETSRDGLLEELADCQLLLWDAARRAGHTPEDVIHFCEYKLAKNKERIWPQGDPDQPVEHAK